MFGQLILWGCIILEAGLLVRGLLTKLAFRYPVFYCYISFVLLQSLLRFFVRLHYPNFYPWAYWITELLGVVVGSVVVFEIYKIGLAAFPGTAKMARRVLYVLFVLAITKVAVDTWIAPNWHRMGTTGELELGLRAVQAISIVALITLFMVYSIRFGRNLKGILLGYGIFVSLRLLVLVFAGADTGWQGWLSRVLPPINSIAYFAVLLVWLSQLWSYQENPVQGESAKLEQGYQRMSAATRQKLRDARGYLGKAVR